MVVPSSPVVPGRPRDDSQGRPLVPTPKWGTGTTLSGRDKMDHRMGLMAAPTPGLVDLKINDRSLYQKYMREDSSSLGGGGYGGPAMRSTRLDARWLTGSLCVRCWLGLLAGLSKAIVEAARAANQSASNPSRKIGSISQTHFQPLSRPQLTDSDPNR